MYKIPSVEEIKRIKKDVKIIDFFAGAGGSGTGYKMAGGDVILVNEFIDLAADSYSANWPETIVLRDDIRGINPLEILERVNMKPCELDVVSGSPPCINFSTAGKVNNLWGKERDYLGRKQINIEDLFFDYIKIIEVIKPKVLIAENVKGLIIGNSKGYFNEIMNKMKNAGYYVEARLLNSAYLGVPQRRERVIFIGIRNDIMREEYKGRLHPKPKTDYISLKEAFTGLQYDEAEINELKEKIKESDIYNYLIKLLPGENQKGNRNFNLIKSHPDLPAGTLTANVSFGSACIKHWDNRSFTIGEFKRIMSLPDDYILLGGYSRQGGMIGNMVPPLMAKAVLEHLKELDVFK